MGQGGSAKIIRLFSDGPKIDPTGTGRLRQSFQAEGNRRLAQLRSQTYAVLVESDAMAARRDPLAQLRPDPGHRLAEFTGWFQRAAESLLWREQWWGRFVERAFESGAVAGSRLVGVPPNSGGPVPAVYRELAQREFAGIAAAILQQVARQVALASVGGMKPLPIYRAVLGVLRKTGAGRMKAAVNTLTVKAHNAARLAAFGAAGIKMVGVDAERLEPSRTHPGRISDAHQRRFVRQACDHGRVMLLDKTKERARLEAALLRANKLFERQRAETEAEAARAAVELERELARFEREVARELAGEGLTPSKATAQAELAQAQAEARASIEAIKQATAAREVEAKAAWERVKAARATERKALYPARRPEETGIPVRSTRVPPPGYERVGEALRVGLDIPARLLGYGSAFLNVETAGDDRVCQICEDIAEDGPYSLFEAQSLIPAHVNCRCTFVPAFVNEEEEVG